MRTFLKFLVLAPLLALAGHFTAAVGQTQALTADAIVAKAAEQREAYINEFKNLLSQETKTFETFDKNGQPKKKRTIVSTFIVYQPPAGGSVGEFRNVISVDGRPIENADKRAQDFFTEIVNAEPSGKVWDRIEKESARYDESISINGMTLFEGIVLEQNIRPAFEFKYEGAGEFEGNPVQLISYSQVRDSRYISMEPRRAANDGNPELVFDIELPRNSTARVNGRFWIDADTFQIRKEERRVDVQYEGNPQSVPAVETMLLYQDSTFSILTPKRVVFTQYRLGKGLVDRKELRVTFDYQNFTKPNVEVRGAEIKS